MIIEELIHNMFIKIQVVHAIPGRMRLHIPYAKKIPKEWQFEEMYFNSAKQIKGVKKVEFCYETANALVLYDPKVTSQERLLETFKDIAKLAAKHNAELSKFTPEQKDEAYAYLNKLVTTHLSL